IRKCASLSWREALWGYEHQLIGWSDVVDLAVDRLRSDSDEREIELSCLNKSNTSRIGELLRELAASEPEKLGLMSAKKWLFLVLAWTLDNKDRADDPLAEVETIYADFDYPDEIESFVRYMPMTDGYDPSQHSRKDNENRLFENWRKYLDVARHEVGVIS
ncbi:MAG: DUF2247 family protein, partial [Azoarcus sp.]|nr:DUF2247 family protein [Azoarcus sp.]